MVFWKKVIRWSQKVQIRFYDVVLIISMIVKDIEGKRFFIWKIWNYVLDIFFTALGLNLICEYHKKQLSYWKLLVLLFCVTLYIVFVLFCRSILRLKNVRGIGSWQHFGGIPIYMKQKHPSIIYWRTNDAVLSFNL